EERSDEAIQSLAQACEMLPFARNDESCQLVEQIPPSWDQRCVEQQIILSRSALHLLIASNGMRHRGMHFIPDHHSTAVRLGEAGNERCSQTLCGKFDVTPT